MAAAGSSDALHEVDRVTVLHRLRADTHDAHLRVETATGLPGSLRTIGDYVRLLQRLRALHVSVEARLAAPTWQPAFLEVGIDLAAHRRSHLLVDDLGRFRAEAAPTPTPPPWLGSFGAALGCLYVVEGSAIGGRVLAPIVDHRLGGVPTSFLRGGGRPQPASWLAIRNALQRYDGKGGSRTELVDGALRTFDLFGEQLDQACWSS